MTNEILEESLELSLKFDEKGLLPVVVQDISSNKILMLAYVNKEALDLTLSEGYATFWTRSRQKIWRKGEESGNRLKINEILVDCDQDALVYRVSLEGEGACHTRAVTRSPRLSCFYRKILNGGTIEYVEGSK